MRNSVCRSVLHVKSQLKVLGGRIIRAALRAALEKCYNASSPKSWFSPELEPAQVKTTSTLMILGSGPSVPFLNSDMGPPNMIPREPMCWTPAPSGQLSGPRNSDSLTPNVLVVPPIMASRSEKRSRGRADRLWSSHWVVHEDPAPAVAKQGLS